MESVKSTRFCRVKRPEKPLMFEEFFDFLKPLMKCQPTEQPNNKKYHKCLQSKHTIKVIRKT